MRAFAVMAALLLAVPVPALAQGAAIAPATAGQGVTTAGAYVAAASAGDLYESTASDLVLRTEGGSPEVQRFAQTMITDHHNMSTQMRTAAEGAGLRPGVPVMTPQQQAMVAQLQAASGAQRERLYVMQQLQAHREALVLHQGYARNGDLPALRAVARTAAQVVEGHLRRVQELVGAQ